MEEELRNKLLGAGLEKCPESFDFFFLFFVVGNVFWDSTDAPPSEMVSMSEIVHVFSCTELICSMVINKSQIT